MKFDDQNDGNLPRTTYFRRWLPSITVSIILRVDFCNSQRLRLIASLYLSPLSLQLCLLHGMFHLGCVFGALQFLHRE